MPPRPQRTADIPHLANLLNLECYRAGVKPPGKKILDRLRRQDQAMAETARTKGPLARPRTSGERPVRSDVDRYGVYLREDASRKPEFTPYARPATASLYSNQIERRRREAALKTRGPEPLVLSRVNVTRPDPTPNQRVEKHMRSRANELEAWLLERKVRIENTVVAGDTRRERVTALHRELLQKLIALHTPYESLLQRCADAFDAEIEAAAEVHATDDMAVAFVRAQRAVTLGEQKIIALEDENASLKSARVRLEAMVATRDDRIAALERELRMIHGDRSGKHFESFTSLEKLDEDANESGGMLDI